MALLVETRSNVANSARTGQLISADRSVGPSTVPSLQERGGTRTTIILDDFVELRGAGGGLIVLPRTQTDHNENTPFMPGKEYLSKARLAAAGLLRASQAADS